jgi:hypothetical protein
MSAAFAAMGLALSFGILIKTKNYQLFLGALFFFSMELLQAIQYLFIAENINSPICNTQANKILTLLGYLHICLQPYFCHVN